MSYISPSPGDVHINAPLTNISIAYFQEAEKFIAAKVFPTVAVEKQSDAYYIYEPGDFNRDEMTDRAPGTQTAGGSYKTGKDQYYTRVMGFHTDIPDQVRANVDDIIELDWAATEFVTKKGLIKREKSWVHKFFTAFIPGAMWTFVLKGGSTRSDPIDPETDGDNEILFWNNGLSTPIEDIRMMKRYVSEATSDEPNTLTLGRAVYDVLLDHPDILGRLDRGQTPKGPAIANKVALAALFELDNIYVMNAVENVATEGHDPINKYIGGKHALLSYAPAKPGLMTSSAGYTFSWKGLVGAGKDGMRIKKFRMEPEASDRVEIEMAYDQKKINSSLGAFFSSIVQ